MLYTASFYDPEDWVGRRYRVSRAHPRGKQTGWELAPRLYPDRLLLDAYREGAVDFNIMSIEYRLALDLSYKKHGEFRDWVDGLDEAGDLTLLCFERGEKLCHRRVAAQWLLERVPGLESGHLR